MTKKHHCIFRRVQPLGYSKKSIYTSLNNDNWNIGKVQSFCKLKGKKMKEQEYKHSSVDLSMADIGVLCTWFTECESQFT